MTALKAAASKDTRPANSSNYGALPSQNSGEYALTAALALNDTIDICKLPAGEVPVDLVGHCDDLDSDGSPAIVLNIGIYDPETGNPTSDADAFNAASAVAQAGGVFRMDEEAARKIAPVDYDRLVRITVATGPATGATSGGIGCTLISRPANLDD